MPLSPEQQQQLATFPPVLRALVEAELAAGNTVVEIGSGFPAPPVGACARLARKVSTRPRESGGGLSFYERNGSRYSGEFTDDRRFFFVLEPPDPPPPEPDMDAIRQRLADAETSPEERNLVMRQPATPVVRAAKAASPTRARSRRAARDAEPEDPSRRFEARRHVTSTGTAWLLHFRDRRPPQEIAHQLERDLMTPLPARMESGRLVYAGSMQVVGAPYSFLLAFEAAGVRDHGYSLRVEATWAGHTEAARDYDRRTSESWFASWTREFRPSAPARPGATSTARYRALCEAALEAERAFGSVEAIQQAIVAAMKQGATFATAHKEGGTAIAWQHGKFVSRNHGESEEQRDFPDEAGFLRYLRQFFDGETSRGSYPGKLPELDVWRLIHRQLRP